MLSGVEEFIYWKTRRVFKEKEEGCLKDNMERVSGLHRNATHLFNSLRLFRFNLL